MGRQPAVVQGGRSRGGGTLGYGEHLPGSGGRNYTGKCTEPPHSSVAHVGGSELFSGHRRGPVPEQGDLELSRNWDQTGQPDS